MLPSEELPPGFLDDDSSEDDSDCEFQDTLPKASLCPARLKGQKLSLVQKLNDDYLAMLNDHDRNRFFWSAMESLPVRGQRVLDLGAGTGLLSLMAAKLGAKSVVAIDASADLAEVVEWSAKHNGLSEVVHVKHGHSTTLSLPVEELADVIVSETFGVLLLQEGCLGSLQHAREKLAKPGAAVIPAGGAQFAMLVMSPTLRAVSSAQVANSLNLDLAHVGQVRETNRIFFSAPGGFCINSLPDAAPISDRVCVLEVDFHRAIVQDVPAVQQFRVKALRDGQVDAIVASWEAWGLADRASRLTTHAEDTKGKPWGFARDAHWGQGIQFVEDEDHHGSTSPFEVKAGEELLLTVRFSVDGGTACQFALERIAGEGQLAEGKASAVCAGSDETAAKRQKTEGADATMARKSKNDVEVKSCVESKWILNSACVPLLCDAPDPRAARRGQVGSGTTPAYAETLSDSSFWCPDRLRSRRPELVQAVNDDYFALLWDEGRANFFRQALQSLTVADKRVLDLGSGAGLLGLLAARLGAKHVLEVEASRDMAALAREGAAKNGLEDLVQVVHALSSRLEIPDEDQRADIIVCEPYDVFLTGQGGSGSIDFLVDARRRLAKPTARVIPAGGAQFAMLVMSPTLSMRATVGDANSIPVSLANLGELLDTASVVPSRKKGFRWSCLPDLQPMSGRACLFELDFQTAERKSVPRRPSVVLEVLHEGIIDAVVTSWEVWAGDARQHRLSAHADETRDQPWGFAHDVVFGQGIQLIVEESGAGGASEGGSKRPAPFVVTKGELLRLTAHVSESRELLHFSLQRGDAPLPPLPTGRGRAKRRD